MQELNQKMFSLVKMIPRVIIKKVAIFPPFSEPDLDRYTAALDALEPACDTYLEQLSNDEVTVVPSDVFDLRNLIRNMQQAAFFDFLEALELTRDYIVAKVAQLSDQETDEPEPDQDVTNGGDEPEEEPGQDVTE